LTERSGDGGHGKTIREQIELLSLAEGFFSSSVLFTLQKLRVFQFLGQESKSAEELAALLGFQASPPERLLNAGVILCSSVNRCWRQRSIRFEHWVGGVF